MEESRQPYLKTPLALPVLFFTGGIILFQHFQSTAAIIAPLAVSLISLLISFFHPTSNHGTLFYGGILMFFCSIGAISLSLHSPSGIDKLNETKAFEGTVMSSVMTTTGSRSIVDVSQAILHDGSLRKTNHLRVILHTDDTSLTPGTEVRFPARLFPISDIPVLDPDRYAARMRTQGIIWQSRVRSDEVIYLGNGSGIRAISLRCRDRIENIIQSSGLRPEAKAFINATLTGDRSLLTTSTRQEFANAGIAHILALSGLHLAIIASILAGILTPLDLVVHYKVRFIAVIILIWAFTLITGMTPPTLRACVMATVFYIDLLLERPHSRVNALCAAALVILVISPTTLFDPGFQLSVACVGTIILFAETLNPFRQHEHPRLHTAASAVVASSVAAAGSWMLTAHYFGKLSLLTLPSNLIVIPLLFPYILLVTIYTILLSIGLDVGPLRFLLDNGAEGLTLLARHTASSTINFSPGPEAPILWGAAVVLGAVAFHYKRRGRIKYIPAALCLCGAITAAFIFRTDAEPAMIISTSQGTSQISYRHASGSGTDRFLRGATTVQPYGPVRFAIVQKKAELLPHEQINEITTADIIMLAGSFKGSISPLIIPGSQPLVIIGPHLRAGVRQSIMSEARTLGLRTHSLRDDGPLRLPLSSFP